MIYIAAGTLEQARYYARENGLKPEQWRYVASIRDVQGVPREAGAFHIYGTFWRRSDSGSIYDCAKHRGLL